MRSKEYVDYNLVCTGPSNDDLGVAGGTYVKRGGGELVPGPLLYLKKRVGGYVTWLRFSVPPDLWYHFGNVYNRFKISSPSSMFGKYQLYCSNGGGYNTSG